MPLFRSKTNNISTSFDKKIRFHSFQSNKRKTCKLNIHIYYYFLCGTIVFFKVIMSESAKCLINISLSTERELEFLFFGVVLKNNLLDEWSVS